jgi:hypothetical protein
VSLAGLLLVALLGVLQDGDPGAAARAILAGDDYQTELPERESLVEADGGSPGMPSGAVREPSWRIPPMLARFVLSGLMVVAILVVVTALVLLIAGRGRAARGPGPEAPARVATARAQGPTGAVAPGDPDGLAAEGRFGEAIHALFLHTLLALPDRSRPNGGRFPPGTTGRELVTAAALDGPRRAALEGLLQAVERWLFGAFVPARGDYEDCQRLAGALRTTDEG